MSTGAGGTGILLSNLGTPDAPTPAAVRRYLREFLPIAGGESAAAAVAADPYGVVLLLRPRKSAHAYQRIWTAAGSPLPPLRVNRKRRWRQLRRPARCQHRARHALRYAVDCRGVECPARCDIAACWCCCCTRSIPRRPPHPPSTPWSIVARLIDQPDLHFISDYHDRPWYIEALATSIREAWRERPPAQRLLFSFHGMPQRSRLAGDPITTAASAPRASSPPRSNCPRIAGK